MVPDWAKSMVGNYRQAFKQKYDKDYPEGFEWDNCIWQICNEVFDDSNQDLEETTRLEEMLASLE
jgi:hypothetical protein